MKNNKTLYLLAACLAISLLFNAGVIYNTLSFRGLLKDKYITTVKEIADSLSSSNDGGNRYRVEQGIGQGFATGAALDEQIRFDDSKPYLHFRMIQEINFAVANKNYSNVEKSKIVGIYYKHIKNKSLTKSYIDIRTELMEQELDYGLPPAEQL